MCKLSQSLIAGLLIAVIGLTAPGALRAQESDDSTSGQSAKKDQTRGVGELSLDDLKAKRSMVENARDLGDSVKRAETRPPVQSSAAGNGSPRSRPFGRTG